MDVPFHTIVVCTPFCGKCFHNVLTSTLNRWSDFNIRLKFKQICTDGKKNKCTYVTYIEYYRRITRSFQWNNFIRILKFVWVEEKTEAYAFNVRLLLYWWKSISFRKNLQNQNDQLEKEEEMKKTIFRRKN